MSQNQENIKKILEAHTAIREIVDAVNKSHPDDVKAVVGINPGLKDPCASTSWFGSSKKPAQTTTKPSEEPKYELAAYQETAQKLYGNVENYGKLSETQLSAIHSKLDAAEKLRETTIKQGKIITTTKNVYAVYGEFVRDIAETLYNIERTEEFKKLKDEVQRRTNYWGSFTSTISKNVSFNTEFNSVANMINFALGHDDDLNVLNANMLELINLYKEKVNDPDFAKFMEDKPTSIKFRTNINDEVRNKLIQIIDRIAKKLFSGFTYDLSILRSSDVPTFIKDAFDATNRIIEEVNKQNPVANPGGGSAGKIQQTNLGTNLNPFGAANLLKQQGPTSAIKTPENVAADQKKADEEINRKSGSAASPSSTSSGAPVQPQQVGDSKIKLLNSYFKKFTELKSVSEQIKRKINNLVITAANFTSNKNEISDIITSISRDIGSDNYKFNTTDDIVFLDQVIKAITKIYFELLIISYDTLDTVNNRSITRTYLFDYSTENFKKQTDVYKRILQKYKTYIDSKKTQDKSTAVGRNSALFYSTKGRVITPGDDYFAKYFYDNKGKSGRGGARKTRRHRASKRSTRRRTTS